MWMWIVDTIDRMIMAKIVYCFFHDSQAENAKLTEKKYEMLRYACAVKCYTFGKRKNEWKKEKERKL